MKKLSLFLAAILVFAALTGCGESSNSTTQAATTEAASKTTEAATTEATTEASAKAEKPTFTMDDYPFIDGSTANHPLLARIYQETMGIDRETAKSLVDFDLGSTGSIWENILLGARTPAENTKTVPDLLVVYEAPENIKADYAKEFEQYEIEPLGRDGLVFLVNSNNPVESITVEQLISIYRGTITNWKELGGNDEEIIPFQRNKDSGSQTLFDKVLMNGESYMEPKKELRVGSMDGLIDQIAAYDGSGSAIGFSVFYYANEMYANPNLKIIKVDGIEPTNESIETGEYPLSNDFYVVINKDEPADSKVRQLRDWLLTSEGKAILEDENYVWARSFLDATGLSSAEYQAMKEAASKADSDCIVVK